MTELSSARRPQDGPLTEVRIVEVGGIGPAPFAGMLLAQMGADVVRVERLEPERVLPGDPRDDLLQRGKRLVGLDLKAPDDVAALLELAAAADVLVEGFRPGVAERLGFGPQACHARRPALVYGRMTGWGQDGPFAARAGHDVNYIGLTGALHAIGPSRAPAIPLNLVGDFGAGSLYLVAGVLAALLEARATGRGRVVDCAIVDGTAHLLASVHLLMNAGAWRDEREANLLDGGAPYYAVYETADGGHMAVGAIEPRFYAALLATLGLDLDPAAQDDEATWPGTRAALAEAFAAETRAAWETRFAGVDACVSPVLGLVEAAAHPHLAERGTLLDEAGRLRAAPAPRFVPPVADGSADRRPEPAAHADVLAGWAPR